MEKDKTTYSKGTVFIITMVAFAIGIIGQGMLYEQNKIAPLQLKINEFDTQVNDLNASLSQYDQVNDCKLPTLTEKDCRQFVNGNTCWTYLHSNDGALRCHDMAEMGFDKICTGYACTRNGFTPNADCVKPCQSGYKIKTVECIPN